MVVRTSLNAVVDSCWETGMVAVVSGARSGMLIGMVMGVVFAGDVVFWQLVGEAKSFSVVD